MNPSVPFDAVVIGGGAAGLSAALSLGRACRRTLLASAGPPRNAPAEAAHNVFTRDGTPPAELVRLGLAQLEPYGIEVRSEAVVDARAHAGRGFTLTFEGGDTVDARRLVLATGVEDVLPGLPGLAALWGHTVFHCPYCHGWEVRDRPLAVFGRGADAVHMVTLMRGWTRDLVLFTDGPAGLDEPQRAAMARHGVTVHEEAVERLEGHGDRLEAVVLAGGGRVERAGMLLRPPQRLRSDLAHRLGCPLSDDGRVVADAFGRTPVPGVFVAGDAGPNMQSVMVAAATGSMAAAMLNHELLEEEFGASNG